MRNLFRRNRLRGYTCLLDEYGAWMSAFQPIDLRLDDDEWTLVGRGRPIEITSAGFAKWCVLYRKDGTEQVRSRVDLHLAVGDEFQPTWRLALTTEAAQGAG